MQLEISIHCLMYRQKSEGWGNCDGEIELIKTINRANNPPLYMGCCGECGTQVRFTVTPLIIETTSNSKIEEEDGCGEK